MYSKIALRHPHLRDKLKGVLFYFMKSRAALKAWKARHDIVFNHHPGYIQSAGREKEREHQKIWACFGRCYTPETYRICEAISGDADPGIIPEEIFQADIEPTLNRKPEAHFLGNKSFYNQWFPKGIFPKDYFHNVDGQLLDSTFSPLYSSQLALLANNVTYPVVMKPNTDSWGGNDIDFIEDKEQLISKMSGEKNFVVQEKIFQHQIQARLHPESLNTVRVYLYRSIKDNSVNIINISQRMGCRGKLDNVASGGLVSLIKKDGCMHGYALDRYGKKYMQHPVTGLSFVGELPEFQKMKKLAVEIASSLFYLRVVGLDLCYDRDGRWRAIEINTKGHSIRFAQYAGQPFFGEFTDEVIEYCKENHWAFSV